MLFRQSLRQTMLLNKYLKAILILVTIDSIFLTFAYSALLDSSLVPLILGARLLVDITFIAIASRHIKLTKLEVILMTIVLISCLFGTLPGLNNSSAYSISRFFNDVSAPLIFVLKVSALRSLYRQDTNALSIKKLSKVLMYLSALQVLIFVYFSAQTGAYAGVTPPINLPVAMYLGTFNHIGLAATVILVALSGKRSFIMSVAIVSVFTIILKGSRRNKAVLIAMLAATALLFIVLGNEKVNVTVDAANELLNMTEVRSINLDSEQLRTGLYVLTAGRSEEFYGILSEMRPWSWLIGLGPGFTYGYLHSDGLVEGYANSHFSPLSLTYKFGILFTMLFYAYLVSTIRGLLKITYPNAFIVGCVLMLFLLQSFFAFNLYVEPYFPVFLGLGMAIISIANRNKGARAKKLTIETPLTRQSKEY